MLPNPFPDHISFCLLPIHSTSNQKLHPAEENYFSQLSSVSRKEHYRSGRICAVEVLPDLEPEDSLSCGTRKLGNLCGLKEFPEQSLIVETGPQLLQEKLQTFQESESILRIWKGKLTPGFQDMSVFLKNKNGFKNAGKIFWNRTSKLFFLRRSQYLRLFSPIHGPTFISMMPGY